MTRNLPAPQNPLGLTRKEICAGIGIALRTFHHYRKVKGFPKFANRADNGRVYWDPADVRQWAEANRAILPTKREG